MWWATISLVVGILGEVLACLACWGRSIVWMSGRVSHIASKICGLRSRAGYLGGGGLWKNPVKLVKLLLKSFGNSYSKFVILDIKFRFTCGKSDLY